MRKETFESLFIALGPVLQHRDRSAKKPYLYISTRSPLHRFVSPKYYSALASHLQSQLSEWRFMVLAWHEWTSRSRELREHSALPLVLWEPWWSAHSEMWDIVPLSPGNLHSKNSGFDHSVALYMVPVELQVAA